MSARTQNHFVLSGQLIELSALRRTPAGLAVVEAKIAHHSKQLESGVERSVELEVAAVALGEWANLLCQAPLGIQLTVQGFFAARSQRSRQPILHLTAIEFLENNLSG